MSDHFNGKTFFNPSGRGRKKLKEVIHWSRTRQPMPWPKWIKQDFEHQIPSKLKSHEAALTYINHDTFLIQTHTTHLITDPIFSNRASPFAFAGPHRVRPPAVSIADLPKIDIVLVTHNHYDHMDIPSLKALYKRSKPLFVVPLRNAIYLHKAGIKNIHELDWWESLDHEVRITLTPAEHWSARGFWDRNKALWGSFLIEQNGHKIYHAGDTGYGSHFSEIYKRLGSPTVSLLPIGAYEPRWFMKEQHMNPAEAVQAHLDLKSELSIAMHFGTFHLTDEAIDEPITHLKQAMISHKISQNHFKVLNFGETWVDSRKY
ncbi:MAG: MBL fold metallo-hydrolase [Deltaproteobacteria bacterium]|nr:MAG: MBL fold metallo-hydrolase [Deltaproteobacteria bacterium]